MTYAMMIFQRSSSSPSERRPRDPQSPNAKPVHAMSASAVVISSHRKCPPADKIDMKDLNVQVVTSNGDTLKTPLAGAGAPNPYCATFKEGTRARSHPARSPRAPRDMLERYC
jgi:hypothetical protein